MNLKPFFFFIGNHGESMVVGIQILKPGVVMGDKVLPISSRSGVPCPSPSGPFCMGRNLWGQIIRLVVRWIKGGLRKILLTTNKQTLETHTGRYAIVFSEQQYILQLNCKGF
jgi:hypothetical protein